MYVAGAATNRYSVAYPAEVPPSVQSWSVEPSVVDFELPQNSNVMHEIQLKKSKMKKTSHV